MSVSYRHTGHVVGASLFFMIVGVIFWGGFNTAMEATNTLEFCISCHEMEVNVYQEYKDTVHYSNRTGVRATCPDCHVPKPWIHKMVRKVQATNELFHKALGTIDTPEKFDVVVTTNLFGDILSDESSQVVGGLGMAPAANIGDDETITKVFATLV